MAMPSRDIVTKVPPKSYELLSLLSEVLKLPKRRVMAMAIEHLARECGILKDSESAQVPVRQPPPSAEGDPARAAIADTLYLVDGVMTVFDAMLSTYPDLRTECSVPFAQLQSRFVEVAQSWGLWQGQQPAEEGNEEATEQQAENP